MDSGRQKCQMSPMFPVARGVFEEPGGCPWASTVPGETEEVSGRLPISPAGLRTRIGNDRCLHFEPPPSQALSRGPSPAALEEGGPSPGRRKRGNVCEWEAGSSWLGCRDARSRREAFTPRRCPGRELCACLTSGSYSLQLSKVTGGLAEGGPASPALHNPLPHPHPPRLSARPGLLREMEKVTSEGHPICSCWPMGCPGQWPSRLCEEKGGRRGLVFVGRAREEKKGNPSDRPSLPAPAQRLMAHRGACRRGPCWVCQPPAWASRGSPHMGGHLFLMPSEGPGGPGSDADWAGAALSSAG